MKLLNEATRQLRGRSHKPDPDYDRLRTQLVNLRKVLGQVKPGEGLAMNTVALCVGERRREGARGVC